MTDRVVLISGGAGGIGTAVAARFLALHDVVVLADRSEDGLAAAVASLPGAVTSVRADVRIVADCDRMVAEVVERAGHLECS